MNTCPRYFGVLMLASAMASATAQDPDVPSPRDGVPQELPPESSPQPPRPVPPPPRIPARSELAPDPGGDGAAPPPAALAALPEAPDPPLPRPKYTSQSAIEELTAQFGASSLATLVGMKGALGDPQPNEWHVVAVDLDTPFLLHAFVSQPGTTIDEGEFRSLYPDKPPKAFFDSAKVKIDSHDAFIVLDEAAEKAKVGFDKVDFHLRGREFSEEPVWSLTALDRDGFTVGVVDISAVNGKTLRTVWFRRAARRALPTVEDSALVRALRPR